mgnify:CR=1 FL=1
MTDKDIEKLLQNFGQTLANDGEAFGMAVALSKKDAQNVATSFYASPFELGYMISKSVETIVSTFETEEELEAFSRGLVETIKFINDKRRSKRLH